MKNKSLYLICFLPILILLLSCTPKDPETGYPIIQEDITFIVEPDLWKDCPDHPITRDCLIINGKGTYELIRGFKHKEGVWKKILVDKYENTNVKEGRLADASLHDFILKEQLDEIREEDPTPRRLCEFYEGQWTEGAEKSYKINNTDLQEKYCEHKPQEC